MRRTKAITLALFALIAAAMIGPGPASADKEFDKYALETVSAQLSTAQAGAHADLTVDIQLSKTPEGTPYAFTRDFIVRLPPGFFGNPLAVPNCTLADFGESHLDSECPQDAQVGVTEITMAGSISGTLNEPVYNMESPGGDIVARFGFYAGLYPTLVNIRLNPDDYSLVAAVEGASAVPEVTGATTTFWGVPAAPSHDALRLTPLEALQNKLPSGGRPSGQPEIPFLTNPTDCEEDRQLTVTAISYQLPGSPTSKSAPFPQIGGCELLEFDPQVKVATTTAQASSSSGASYELDFPSKGLELPNLNAASPLRRAEVFLPEGMTLNPSAANGQGVCTEADFARETYNSGPNVGCPETSKLGTVLSTSPILDREARGSLYLAKPYENPVGTLIAFYMVIKVPDRGVMVKLVGEVTPDPSTGQLKVVFDDVPPLPVGHFELSLRESANAPLITPPRCGSFDVISKFNPWSEPDEVTTRTNSFQITSGADRGTCPPASGPLPFNPGYIAGANSNTAGSYSPFYFRLTRRDGDQDMTKISVKLPPGVVGKLAGLSKCSDAAIAQARSRTGRNGGHEELASPSCPASSEIGHTLGGAGVGQVLTYAEGKLYLSGPFNGAPLSVVSILPAVSGPFDLGNVVTRLALRINPKTAEVLVDGSSSDPIPHILAGIPLKVRDIRVYVDRPNFTLNSTSCAPKEAGATLWSGGDNVFSVVDDFPHSLTSPYQAAECASLGFKPNLRLQLKGGTKRGGHPGLIGTYKPRPGDANLKDMVVRLPRSAFLDQAHIRTICTRVQFAADACPKAAQYGYIKAWTPLLDEPLEGPVWLRSSNHKLPDLVFDLHGFIDVEVATRIDSAKGGIRANVESPPDAPLTKVVLRMQGAKKGLIINSRNLCGKPAKANAEFTGHNGKEFSSNPVMEPDCGGKKRKR
jgi:hypothetical protein